jgi:hypothetical protein
VQTRNLLYMWAILISGLAAPGLIFPARSPPFPRQLSFFTDVPSASRDRGRRQQLPQMVDLSCRGGKEQDRQAGGEVSLDQAEGEFLQARSVGESR